MQVKIVDTTLRDGEQKAGIALGITEKVRIAKLLDEMGIYQIEAGIPAMGGTEKKSIQMIAEAGLKSKISTWNRMKLEDIKHAADCRTDFLHISVPCSEIQICTKLMRDKKWVLDNMRKCISYAKEHGYTVTIGLEDASRAETGFMMKVIGAAFSEGAQRIRYADTVGILYRQKAYEDIEMIKSEFKIEVEIHTHNDFGMAVSNAITAVEAGADYVDCTIGGIGERSGNCNYGHFIKAARDCLGLCKDIKPEGIEKKQKEIMQVLRIK